MRKEELRITHHKLQDPMLTNYASGAARRFLALTVPPLRINPKLKLAAVIALVIFLGAAVAWLPLKSAVLLIGGAAFLILLLIEPGIGLYALIPAIPFSSLLVMPIAGAKAGVMEMILLLTLAAGLLKLMARQSTSGAPFNLKTGPLFVPFILLIVGVSLSWLTTLSIGASLIETAKWIEMFILYLFIINLFPAKQIKWAVLVIIVAGTAQALLGLYQFIFKVGPEGFLLFDGRFLRAYGTFAQPNPYAGYLGLVLPLALSLAIWAVTKAHTAPAVGYAPHKMGQKFSRFLQRGLYLALFLLPLGLMLAALFASQSRGAMLGFACAAVVTIISRSKKMTMLFVTLVVVAALLALISSFDINLAPTAEPDSPYAVVTQRLADAITLVTTTDVATAQVTDANFANIERLAHWQAAANMWRDNLWLGVGFGNYAVVYPAYAIGRWQDPLGHAHNYLLNIGAEAGLMGITVYLIFWIFTFGLLWMIVQRSTGFYQAVAAGGVGIIVHLHVHNMVDNLYVQGMYLHIAIILGLVSIICLHTMHKPNRETFAQ